MGGRNRGVGRSGGVSKSKNVAGLQCPWSNCFPQAFEMTQVPCTTTQFPTFREIQDHIWKYHSALLSCDKCGHRFTNGKRQEKDREELDRMKKKHSEEKHPDNKESVDPVSSYLYIIRMTYKQDESLKKWEKDKGVSLEDNYVDLCRCLFGEGIIEPLNPRYHYFKPEYETNADSAELGSRNIEYAKKKYSSATFQGVTGRCEPPYTAGPSISYKKPLELDEDVEEPPSAWGNRHLQQSKHSVDSGYVSQPQPHHVGASYHYQMGGMEDYPADQRDPNPPMPYQHLGYAPWPVQQSNSDQVIGGITWAQENGAVNRGGLLDEQVDTNWSTLGSDLMDCSYE